MYGKNPGRAIFALSLILSVVHAGDFSITLDTSQDKSTAYAYAKAFSNSVAKPLLSSFPRTYSSYGVVGQVELSGFFSIESFTLQARNFFKKAVMAVVNDTLQQNGQCCASDLEVTITNVCSWDLTACVSYMLTAIPRDCGDGRLVDPEQCDDANTVPGDGCDAACRIEPGFVCAGGTRFHRDACRNAS
eukprot:CAMPEP_0172159606 /NCGR_PEP_ID=MMETSP1050-20130122/5068_1 /TAXON_ID=233186 /ORGANISM="Cryptomonas curvata, Strain CCAP979/52" /LENGTH=188 /DNA_ID=CAMNT_0012829221 /DNA_START=235 /DNA_END=798 /DNA_ORIENTATION=+